MFLTFSGSQGEGPEEDQARHWGLPNLQGEGEEEAGGPGRGDLQLRAASVHSHVVGEGRGKGSSPGRGPFTANTRIKNTQAKASS